MCRGRGGDMQSASDTPSSHLRLLLRPAGKRRVWRGCGRRAEPGTARLSPRTESSRSKMPARGILRDMRLAGRPTTASSPPFPIVPAQDADLSGVGCMPQGGAIWQTCHVRSWDKPAAGNEQASDGSGSTRDSRRVGLQRPFSGFCGHSIGESQWQQWVVR